MRKPTKLKRTTPRSELAKVRPERLSHLKIPLLKGLTSPELKEIFAVGRILKVGPKVRLIVSDEPADKLFVVLHGRVKYSRFTPRGEEIVLRVFTAGESFGLAATLPDPLHYLGTAEPIAQTELIVWDHKDLVELADRFPQLRTNSLRIALMLLGSMADRHSSLFDGSASNRIGRALVDLGRRGGTIHHQGIDISITNEQLGSLADASRFTVSRTLSKWNKQRVISKSRESVRIHSPEALLANLPTRD
jgi:CRP-like cAMP-binding protein